MRYTVRLIGILLLGQGVMSTTEAHAANGCTVLVKRLERQDRIASVFRCDQLRPARELHREQAASTYCARTNRVRLRRLTEQRAQNLEQCLDDRLHKIGRSVPANRVSETRQLRPADRQGNSRRRQARTDTEARTGRYTTVPGTAERSAAAELIRKLLAQGPGAALPAGIGGKPAYHRHQTFRTGLAWSYAGPIDSMHCVKWKEPSDPHNWDDNYLCTEKDIGLQWSFRGPILGRGLKCIQVNEKSDPHDWHDNYFCWPRDLNVNFRFSSTGRVYGFSCLAIVEPSDPNTWRDNYLCHRPERRVSQ
jgi:hypothetical protein